MRKIKLYPVISQCYKFFNKKLECYYMNRANAVDLISKLSNNDHSCYHIGRPIDAVVIDEEIMILGDPVKNHVEINGVHYDARNVTDDVFGE